MKVISEEKVDSMATVASIVSMAFEDRKIAIVATAAIAATAAIVAIVAK